MSPGSPQKRRVQSPSSSALPSACPRLSQLFLLLSKLSSLLEIAATPEAICDLSEVVKRLAGVQVTSPAAVSAVLKALAESTASLLQVAAASSPVRDKVGDAGGEERGRGCLVIPRLLLGVFKQLTFYFNSRRTRSEAS